MSEKTLIMAIIGEIKQQEDSKEPMRKEEAQQEGSDTHGREKF